MYSNQKNILFQESPLQIGSCFGWTEIRLCEAVRLPVFVTHHAVRVCVAGFRHRQALDHLWSHPGERAHQGHVCCVGQEPGRPKITDLE